MKKANPEIGRLTSESILLDDKLKARINTLLPQADEKEQEALKTILGKESLAISKIVQNQIKQDNEEAIAKIKEVIKTVKRKVMQTEETATRQSEEEKMEELLQELKNS